MLDKRARAYHPTILLPSVGVKHPTSLVSNIISLTCNHITSELIAYNSNVITFYTDAVHLHLDTCTTKGFTGFKEDFIKGTFIRKDLGVTAAESEPACIAGCRIV